MSLTVVADNPWIVVHMDCPITFTVRGSNDAHVLLGEMPGTNFEFNVEAEALREFLRLGTDAMREMDAIHAREEAEAGSAR